MVAAGVMVRRRRPRALPWGCCGRGQGCADRKLHGINTGLAGVFQDHGAELRQRCGIGTQIHLPTFTLGCGALVQFEGQSGICFFGERRGQFHLQALQLTVHIHCHAILTSGHEHRIRCAASQVRLTQGVQILGQALGTRSAIGPNFHTPIGICGAFHHHRPTQGLALKLVNKQTFVGKLDDAIHIADHRHAPHHSDGIAFQFQVALDLCFFRISNRNIQTQIEVGIAFHLCINKCLVQYFPHRALIHKGHHFAQIALALPFNFKQWFPSVQVVNGRLHAFQAYPGSFSLLRFNQHAFANKQGLAIHFLNAGPAGGISQFTVFKRHIDSKHTWVFGIRKGKVAQAARQFKLTVFCHARFQILCQPFTRTGPNHQWQVIGYTRKIGRWQGAPDIDDIRFIPAKLVSASHLGL